MRAEEQTAARYWMKMLLLPDAEAKELWQPVQAAHGEFSLCSMKTSELESFSMLPEGHGLQPYLKHVRDHQYLYLSSDSQPRTHKVLQVCFSHTGMRIKPLSEQRGHPVTHHCGGLLWGLRISLFVPLSPLQQQRFGRQAPFGHGWPICCLNSRPQWLRSWPEQRMLIKAHHLLILYTATPRWDLPSSPGWQQTVWPSISSWAGRPLRVDLTRIERSSVDDLMRNQSLISQGPPTACWWMPARRSE